MADFKVICWNCGGLRRHSPATQDKMDFFQTQYPTAHFSVLAFLETHHRHEEDFPPYLLEFASTHTLIHTPAARTKRILALFFLFIMITRLLPLPLWYLGGL